jgi:hypothetical protein
MLCDSLRSSFSCSIFAIANQLERVSTNTQVRWFHTYIIYKLKQQVKMERFFQIKEQLPLRERSYTDQQGQQKVFVSTGFVLTDGINTVFAEAVGDMARALDQQKPNQQVPHLVDYELSCREWQDSQQQRRFENMVRITKMA